MTELIRDKVPEYVLKGKIRRVRDGEEFEELFSKKLLDGFGQLIAAIQFETNAHEELGDLLQIVKSLAQFYNIPWMEVERAQRDKWRAAGGFEELRVWEP